MEIREIIALCTLIIITTTTKTNGSSKIGQTTRPQDTQHKKNKHCRIVGIADLASHKVKLNESEKVDK